MVKFEIKITLLGQSRRVSTRSYDTRGFNNRALLSKNNALYWCNINFFKLLFDLIQSDLIAVQAIRSFVLSIQRFFYFIVIIVLNVPKALVIG